MTQPHMDSPDDTAEMDEQAEFNARLAMTLTALACDDPIMELALISVVVAHFLAGLSAEHRAGVRDKLFAFIDEKTRECVLAQCNG